MKIGISTYSHYQKASFSFNGVSAKQKEEIRKREEKVSTVLNKAITENRRITVDEVSKEAGCSKDKVWYLFQRNTQLNALWQRIQSDECKSEAQKETEKKAERVGTVLQDAIAEEIKMTREEVAQKAHLSLGEVISILRHHNNINALWKNVRTSNSDKSSDEDMTKNKEKVRAALLEAKTSFETLTLEQLSQSTGLRSSSVRHYIKDESLALLWFLVKTKDSSSFTRDEIQEQTNKIKEQLECAIEQKKSITIREIAETTGIEEGVIDNRIASDETLTTLREQTLSLADKNYQLEVKLIKDILKEAKESGLKITQVYISQKTNIPTSVIQKRIGENAALERLFESIRAREHNYNSKDDIQAQNAQIAAILNRTIRSGKKITISDLAAEYTALKKNTIQSRLGRYPELSTLWEQARAECDVNYGPKEDEIKEQTEKIEKILTDLKSRGEKITSKKLAETVGITQRIALMRIGKSEKLSALWEATCSKPNAQYSEDEVEVQNVMIERILNQRIQDGTKATIYQMAQYLDLSREIVKRRIQANAGLSALYQKSQEI